MRKLLIPLLAALALPTACSNDNVSDKTVNAEIDPKIRKACLPAADFEGCVNAYANPKEKKKKLDFLGMEPIPGWKVIENRPENYIRYFDDKNIRKVKVRGLYGRYITYDYVTRWFQEYIPGTSGFSTTIGSGTTNCYGYGSSMSCTTTPPAVMNIPGRSAVPSGVRQEKTKVIIDCLEREAKWIPGNKKWGSIEGKGITQPIADENCSKIQSLEASNYLKWEKGKPNQQDLLAQEILPGSTPQQVRDAIKSSNARDGINCKSSVWKNKPQCKL